MLHGMIFRQENPPLLQSNYLGLGTKIAIIFTRCCVQCYLFPYRVQVSFVSFSVRRMSLLSLLSCFFGVRCPFVRSSVVAPQCMSVRSLGFRCIFSLDEKTNQKNQAVRQEIAAQHSLELLHASRCARQFRIPLIISYARRGHPETVCNLIFLESNLRSIGFLRLVSCGWGIVHNVLV